MTDIFETKDGDPVGLKPVKVAQSTEEYRRNLMPANLNSEDRSVVHVERPRYGHKM